jgi:hypothetical protein
MPLPIPVLRLTARVKRIAGAAVSNSDRSSEAASKQVGSLSGTRRALGRSCLAALLAAPKAAVFPDWCQGRPFRDM